MNKNKEKWFEMFEQAHIKQWPFVECHHCVEVKRNTKNGKTTFRWHTDILLLMPGFWDIDTLSVSVAQVTGGKRRLIGIRYSKYNHLDHCYWEEGTHTQHT